MSSGLKPLPNELRAADAPPRAEGWSVEPFVEGSAEDFARLRALLADSGFTEEAVLGRFGIARLSEFKQLREGREDDAPLTTPFELLVRLFLDSEAVAAMHLDQVLGADGVGALAGLGLLHAPADTPELRRATILLYPSQGLWIASDVNADPDGGDGPPPLDVVYPAIAEGTQRFVQLMPRDPCDDFVELCSGSGIAALVAARDFARHAWAVDLTARATRFARFNAALNGLANVTAVEGDLWEPLAGRTFDRVVAHPPYMPSFETIYVFRDGGEDGEQITRRIVSGLGAHLRPGGTCFISCMLTDREDAPAERRVREMLGASQEAFDVALVQGRTHEPPAFYAGMAREGKLEWPAVSRRLEAFAELGISQLVISNVLLRRRAAGEPASAPLTERRRLSARTAAADFAWLLDRRARAAAAATEPSALRPLAAPGLRVRLEHERAAEGWVVRECELVAHTPFAAELRCPPWVGALLLRCNGEADARELLDGLCADGLVPADADAARFAEMLLRLAEQGMLEVPAWPFPARV